MGEIPVVRGGDEKHPHGIIHGKQGYVLPLERKEEHPEAHQVQDQKGYDKTKFVVFQRFHE